MSQSHDFCICLSFSFWQRLKMVLYAWLADKTIRDEALLEMNWLLHQLLAELGGDLLILCVFKIWTSHQQGSKVNKPMLAD